MILRTMVLRNFTSFYGNGATALQLEKGSSKDRQSGFLGSSRNPRKVI